MDSTFDSLERLSALHKSGALTDDEFAAEKAKVLNRSTVGVSPPSSPPANPERTAFCRACGKEIVASAKTCPHCGANQTASVGNPPQARSTGKLVIWCAVWTAILWIAGLFIVGSIAGMMNPADPGDAGNAAGRMASVPLLLLGFAASLILSLKGWLPGTKKA